MFLLLPFTAAEIITPRFVKECIIEKTFNDKQLGRHRFLQNHGIAATPSDLNGSYCFQFEASDKGFFHLLQAQNGPRIEIFAYLT